MVTKYPFPNGLPSYKRIQGNATLAFTTNSGLLESIFIKKAPFFPEAPHSLCQKKAAKEQSPPPGQCFSLLLAPLSPIAKSLQAKAIEPIPVDHGPFLSRLLPMSAALSSQRAIMVFVCLPFLAQATLAADSPLSFNRDIRPILSENCLHCHGLDPESREAELRLDQRENAIAQRSEDGRPAIVPGNPGASELIKRITTSDRDDLMPPPKDHDALEPAEIDLLRRWIKEGAEYQNHWSFIPPTRPQVPQTSVLEKGIEAPANAIDHFVRAQLGDENLTPSPPADRATLIRRLSLDLTGLPPSPKEVDAFLSDRSPDAYKKQVERLLRSNRFGEHFARYWLDAARYADSNGYFTDQGRTMWPWRDWVIHAYNDNLPFDRFTIEQLAGDLLPESNQSLKIASGFNRNHMVNNETGIVQEEYRIEYVADRIKTTSTVWMGLTVGCARCHDHKFDPISQRDFYRLFAFFNNVPESGLDGSKGNAAPLLRIPSPDQEKTLAKLDGELAAAKKAYAPIGKSIQAAQVTWEKTAARSTSPAPEKGLLVHLPLDQDANNHGSVSMVGKVPKDDVFTAGAVGGAVHLTHGEPVEAPIDLPLDSDQPFSIGAWIYSDKNAGCIVSKTNDTEAFRGFDLSMRKGLLQFHLIKRWKDDAIEVSTVEPILTRQWQHVFVSYDGSRKASGVKIYIDGQPQQLNINVDKLKGSIANNEPLRIGRRKASASFEGKIDDLRIYDRAFTGKEVADLASGQLIRGTTARPLDKRDPVLAKKLGDYYIDHHAPPTSRDARNQLAALQKKRDDFFDSVPITMVMDEMKKPREAFILKRGVYDQHGETVTAGVPASLGELPEKTPPNRLGFARWLTSPGHPLTSRVTVNRIWQQFFGIGIVKTTEDFGTQGAWPSHPELLDWLAVEFVESGWDIKQLARLIVYSATYRQNSNATPAQFTADPLNQKLARGPRFRLDAEAVRDQALAISGLLAEKIGGPSVKPYQPPGLWKSVSYDGDLGYQPSSGSDLHRRSLYSYWKRQSPPPNMLAFDAGTRETCSVRRSRTNTPLQALVLMNDPVFIEAAEHLAIRTLAESPQASSAERARHAFRLATARYPDAEELQVLTTLHEKQRQHFQANPTAAAELLSSANPAPSPAELAAWTTVSNLILSLDETITKK